MTLRYQELNSCFTPSQLLRACQQLPWCVLLESAKFQNQRGRYSYFSADPAQTWTLPTTKFGDEPFREIREAQKQFPAKSQPGLPPFQGGIIGLLGYELGHCWERLPVVAPDDFATPALAAGLYDWLICFDHAQKKTWLLVHEQESPCTTRPNFDERLEQITHCLKKQDQLAQESGSHQEKTPADQLKLKSNFTQEKYLEVVGQVLEYIKAGDIYQANLSRKLHYPFEGSPLDLYDIIRKQNPAPFAAYFAPVCDWAMISASPEQFLQIENRHVATRPIKGTRPRWEARDTDLFQGIALQAAEKDRAENTMIVDLMRNDLSRVCKTGTVKVPLWCELESFEKVHHLVSEVTGELNDQADLWDLLAATFPGGSITGAPKIRAMEIISQLEQSARGYYCGSLIAAGFDGYLQSSILIRTLLWKNGEVQLSVGGGIVADSIPKNEYSETEHKAAGLIAK